MKNNLLGNNDFEDSKKYEEMEELYDDEILSADNYTDKEVDMEAEKELVEIDIKGIELIKERRLIPLGRLINAKKPYFMKYPVITPTTYNVYAFVSPMGGGKTLDSETYIRLYKYGLITAKEAYELFHQGKELYFYSCKEGSKPVWSLVTDAMFSGTKELLRIKAKGGCRIDCSKEHLILIWNDGIKEKRAGELSINDWVLFPKKLEASEWSDQEGEDNARMCGIFIADGCSNKQCIITNSKFREFIITFFAKNKLKYSERYRNNCWDYRLYGDNMRKFKHLIGIDQEYCVAANKLVPAWIFKNKAYMRTFLQGLVECDGSFTIQSQGKDRKGKQKKGFMHKIELMMKNRQVINSVAQMLLCFGVRSSFRTKISRATNSDMEAKEYYGIAIKGNDNLRKYLTKIGLFTDFQNERVKDWDLSSSHNSNMRYRLDDWMKKASKAMYDIKIAGEYWDYIKKKQYPSDNHRFRELLDKLRVAGYQELVEEVLWLIDNYYMAKISSIEPAGTSKAYDFETNESNFLAGDGTGFFIHNSTNTRALIYYKNKFDPDCIQIIFDPMKMEFSKLSILDNSDKKRDFLLNDVLNDPETGKNINIRVEPDTVPVFHIIPRFALGRQSWDQEEMGYRHGIDNTTIEILRKDGGFVFAEDASKMTEEQLFNSLNYRELRSDQAVHYYLRAAIRICDNKHGEGEWFIQDLIQVLRENVKKFRDMDELDDFEDFENAKEEGKGSLSSTELQLIEKLEKYKDYGFFVSNDAERKKYCVDWRKFIRIGKVLNISFMGFRKTEQVGEDLVRGQADLILERLIEISNEYYDAIRKKEQNLSISPWESYLLQKWKVNLWFEESEVFLPRDCQVTAIKKWPCIKRLDYLMSFGRKYGFKNFGFITQRISKLNPLVFKEASHLFLGSMHGEERDQILNDFGVNRLKFEMADKSGQNKVFTVRDIVTTLNKDKHEWLFINKSTKSIVAIQAFDCPVG